MKHSLESRLAKLEARTAVQRQVRMIWAEDGEIAGPKIAAMIAAGKASADDTFLVVSWRPSERAAA